MRTYSALYDASSGEWAIIAKDEFEDFWFVFQDGVKERSTANTIVSGLNAYVEKIRG